MTNSRHSRNFWLTRTFVSLLALTLLVYVLRGLEVLTFLPGGILLGLIFLCVVTGIALSIAKTRRF